MKQTEPLFQSLFGQQSDTLPIALRKRYGNFPFSDEITAMEGKMDISYSRMMGYFLVFFKIFNILVPYAGQGIPVSVIFKSQLHSSLYIFTRLFYFPGKKPYQFRSRIECKKENELIELLFFGIGWRAQCTYDGNKVLLQHQRYVLKIFGRYIPLPFIFLLGKPYAEEQATSDNSFRMLMNMTHPLFGKMFEYTGEFTFTGKSI